MTSSKSRITALDGIRGFAIFLVIINHFNFDLSAWNFSPMATGIWHTFMLSGPFGVNIFFILCGFLMTFLYPKVGSVLNFIQKRYYRIFPLFLGICTFNIFLYMWKDMPILWQPVFLLTIAYLIYSTWTYLIEKRSTKAFRVIFLFFVMLQLIMIPINILVGRLTQEQFFQLPDYLKFAVTYFANLTLTLWSGWNIPILSGPYWSLAPEVLFYIFYPLLVVKLLKYGKKINIVTAIMILVCTALLVLLINEIFNSVLALSRLNIVRSHAFVVGIVLALLYQQNVVWRQLSTTIRRRHIDFVIFILIPTSMLMFQFFPEKNQFNLNLLHLVLNTLLLFVFISTLIEKTFANIFFSSKILLFLGSISYSAYLIHSHVLKATESVFSRDSVLMVTGEIITGIVITLILSYLVNTLLEKPYFKMREIIDFHVK